MPGLVLLLDVGHSPSVPSLMLGTRGILVFDSITTLRSTFMKLDLSYADKLNMLYVHDIP